MKASLRVIGAFVYVFAAFAAEAKAQPYGTATMPTATPGAGSITASGTYTVKCGYAPTIQTYLYCYPQAGGLVAKAQAQQVPAGGDWAAITVTNLAKGQYIVVLVMTLKKGGASDTIYSNYVGVNVVAAGGAPTVPAGTVSWSGSPTLGAFSITWGGGYKVTAGGWEAQATACSLVAFNASGGDFAGTQANGDAPGATTWGAVTLNGLMPAGQWWVMGVVTMVKKDACDKIVDTQYVYTPPSLQPISPGN